MKTDVFGLDKGRGGYRSLDFEPTLMAQIGRTRPDFRLRTSRRPYWAAAMVAAALILGAVIWMRDSRDERAIAQMASTAFEWLRNGRIDPTLLTSSSSGSMGLGFIVGGSTVSAESQASVTPEESALRQAVLSRIRSQIEAGGGNWTDARPLAFGGVRARVVQPGADPATSITGNIYFDAGGRVFAIEVSAEGLGDHYVPTDFWQCAALDCAATELDRLEAHARQCYEAFLEEPPLAASPGEETQILDPEPLFIRL